jgi:hypothetical protein
VASLDGGIVLCHLDSLVAGQIPALDLLVAGSHENLGAVLQKFPLVKSDKLICNVGLTSLQQMSKTGPCMDCIDFGMVLPLCSTSQHRTCRIFIHIIFFARKINNLSYVVVPTASNEEILWQSSRTKGERGD